MCVAKWASVSRCVWHSTRFKHSSNWQENTAPLEAHNARLSPSSTDLNKALGWLLLHSKHSILYSFSFPLFSSCLTCAFRAYLYTKTRMVFPNFLNLDAYQHRRRRTAGRPVCICKISTLLINSWFACCFLDAIKNARQLQYFHDRDDYINGRGLCAFRISLLIAEVDYTFRTKGFRIICV